MKKEKENKLLGIFRENSRLALTKISKETKIPVSTLFDKLRELEANNIIVRHTSLVDFKKLGYEIRVHYLLASDKKSRDKLAKFLQSASCVNSLCRVSNGFDFFIEVIFKKMDELDLFLKELDNFDIIEKKQFWVMEDLKREGFKLFS